MTPPNDAPENDKPDDEAGEAEPASIAMDPELEAALREATESIETRQAGRDAAEDSPEGDAASAIMAVLQHRVEELELENEGHKDRFVRLQADFDNNRKRALKERQDSLQYGHENLVKDLLGTVDNLERAIEHASQSDGGDLQAMLQGVELVQRELMGFLTKYSVSVIEAEGDAFDPNVHEAMAQIEDADKPVGTVVQVLQKGYQLRDRLLRPARVIVSKAPGEAKPGDGSEESQEQAE